MANSFSINQNLLENLFRQSTVLGPTGYTVVTDVIGIRNITISGSITGGTGGVGGTGVTGPTGSSYNMNSAQVAIGLNAGSTGQGVNSIAIGAYAGPTGQSNNSIILNASGNVISGTGGAFRFYVNPIRDVASTALTGFTGTLFYNSSTSEIVNSPAGTYTNNNISTYTGALFVAGGGYPSSPLGWSDDAITWTTSLSSIGSYIMNVFFNGSRWLAVGGNGLIYYSDDGKLWTLATTLSGELRTIAYSSTLSRWIVGGQYGASYSDDNGITWSAITLLRVSTQCWSIVWNGTYFIAAVSGSGSNFIMRSSNGISWTDSSSGNILVGSMALAVDPTTPTKIVAVGQNGSSTTAYSSDGGDNWLTGQDIFSAGYGYRVACDNSGNFVAMGVVSGFSPTCAYSTNGGANWFTNNITEFANGFSVVFSSSLNKWIVGGSNGTSNIGTLSAYNGTFTTATSAITGPITGVGVAIVPTPTLYWAPPAPTNYQQAIDRLAKAVYALRSNVSIPA